MRTKPISAILLMAFSAIGCSSDKEEAEHRTNPNESASALVQAVDCDHLLSMLIADALAKVNSVIDINVAVVTKCGIEYNRCWDYPGADSGSSEQDASGSPDTGGSSGAGWGGSYRYPPDGPIVGRDYSRVDGSDDGVNAGANEDIVDTDGEYLYLLHGPEFIRMTAWPASDLAQLSSFAIEGLPLDMHVTDDGKVVIYSSVYGIPIYSEAGIQYRSRYANTDDYFVAATNPGNAYNPASNSRNLTKITVLGIADLVPTIEAEYYFEGHYASSQREGQHVRSVLGGVALVPRLDSFPIADINSREEMLATLELLRSMTVNMVLGSTVEDWLPYRMVRRGDSIHAEFAKCEEFYVPTPGTTEYGLTQILSIDLAYPELPPTGSSIVGAADTLYSNSDKLVIASRGWVDMSQVYAQAYSGEPWEDDDSIDPNPGEHNPDELDLLRATASDDRGIGTSEYPLDAPITRNFTHLHAFDLEGWPNQLRYSASATVPGDVHNRLSLQVSGDTVRVATTEERFTDLAHFATERINHLFIFSADGGKLRELGAISDLARGETVSSVSYLGDRAYVNTYRSVNPLYVVDLSNPAYPVVLGETTIPGFDWYVHPLGESHVLTLTRDTAFALQIFDISDPILPILERRYDIPVYPSGYGIDWFATSAFAYFPARGMLAVPHAITKSFGTVVRSTLELFHVDVDSGISHMGSIDHSDLLIWENSGEHCPTDSAKLVRRGLFIDDYLYSISYGGVLVHDMSNLVESAAVVSLDIPPNVYYWCDGGW